MYPQPLLYVVMDIELKTVSLKNATLKNKEENLHILSQMEGSFLTITTWSWAQF